MAVDFVQGRTASPRLREQIRSLLPPRIEGYSVTVRTTRMPSDQIAGMVTELAKELSQRDGNPG
ncbi:MAG: hypothetical protein AAGC81_11475 [Pseudomonadota bacterium]